jgi:hypothetical protein
MSELSTVAIKDGHRGHLHHHTQPMDAERADRISRLAGLERVAQPRTLTPGIGGQSSTYGNPPMTQGYFDSNNQPQIFRERSTVGSASATGSVGGRTTWASESDMYDPDKMSEDQDMENSSMGGFSDEGAASLVGFGEGARTPARQTSVLGQHSPIAGKASAVPPYIREPAPQSPVSTLSNQTTPSTEAQKQHARMIDGMTYDADVVDTVSRTPPPTSDADVDRSPTGAAAAERILRERLGGGDSRTDGRAIGETDSGNGLGKFTFERD